MSGVADRTFNPFAPVKWYYDNVYSQHPLLDTALVGTALAGLGYFVAPKSVDLLNRMTGGSPADADDLKGELNGNPDAMKRFRRRAAMLGGLTGVAYGLHHLFGRQPQKTASGFAFNDDADIDPYVFDNNHAFYNGFPKSKALRALNDDPVLFPRIKGELYQLVSDSSAKPVTSGFNLTNAAINAGVGYGSAWLFGQGMGKLMALPQPITNRLSVAGGVAAAVLDSGILRELR